MLGEIVYRSESCHTLMIGLLRAVVTMSADTKAMERRHGQVAAVIGYCDMLDMDTAEPIDFTNLAESLVCQAVQEAGERLHAALIDLPAHLAGVDESSEGEGVKTEIVRILANRMDIHAACVCMESRYQPGLGSRLDEAGVLYELIGQLDDLLNQNVILIGLAKDEHAVQQWKENIHEDKRPGFLRTLFDGED